MYILLPDISSQNQIVHYFVFCPHCNEGFKKSLARNFRWAHLNSENILAELKEIENNNNQNFPNHINTFFYSAFEKPLLIKYCGYLRRYKIAHKVEKYNDILC